jgi:hypothetical protein
MEIPAQVKPAFIELSARPSAETAMEVPANTSGSWAAESGSLIEISRPDGSQMRIHLEAGRGTEAAGIVAAFLRAGVDPDHPADADPGGRATRRFSPWDRWAGPGLSGGPGSRPFLRYGVRVPWPVRHLHKIIGLRWPRILAVPEAAVQGPVPLVADQS